MFIGFHYRYYELENTLFFTHVEFMDRKIDII